VTASFHPKAQNRSALAPHNDDFSRPAPRGHEADDIDVVAIRKNTRGDDGIDAQVLEKKSKLLARSSRDIGFA
jgi:hypothetical protein